MVDRMRLWRHDALMQHLYETAIFWGDKVLSWTNDINDGFWLAQAYFMMSQYARAVRLLQRPFSTLPPPTPPSPSLANGNTPATTLSCRYLAALCEYRQGHWMEASEILGESNPFVNIEGNATNTVSDGIKVEASMCCLRGMLMLKLNRGDHAKMCFMEALSIDVKCYDAFRHIIDCEMMTPDEEWEFIQQLPYAAQTPHDAEFVQLMYTSRLRKFTHAAEHALTRQRLVQEYGLGDNPDVLCSFADALYAEFRWADCIAITGRVLGMVAIHDTALPLHIACMFHLKHLHAKLFILAHELVRREPERPLSWYAVGVWYLAKGKWNEARQYFSKTSLMDPRFAPAWIAFAHTFAFEGEHDHAVTAYSTCARMFTGSHLPLLFVGMEHILLSNHPQAEEALVASYALCSSDPLLMNERGVMAFARGDFEGAADWFKKAVDLSKVTQSSQKTWVTTYINLGTAYRKLNHLDEAQTTYKKVLEYDPRHPIALGSLGLVYHLLGRLDDAITRYHEALSVNPINNSILELLNLALESAMDAGPALFEQSPENSQEKNKGKQKAAAPGDMSVDEMSIG
ncbi:TPR-like protein [Fistulina hepatica ATCC 64428]|nr:TPR-like protein [Fistulina hepatica ATCC 64428]